MARLSSADPLEKFRFRVDILMSAGEAGVSTPVSMRAGFKEVQMPKRSTNKILYRDSLSPEIHMISPGLSNTEDITLSRGLIADESGGFYAWASQSHKGGPTDAAFSNPLLTAPEQLDYKNTMRKDLTISMLNRQGVVARAWRVYNAFVVNFVPASDLNASEDSEKSVETITVAYEDFEELNPDAITPIPITATVTEKLV